MGGVPGTEVLTLCATEWPLDLTSSAIEDRNSTLRSADVDREDESRFVFNNLKTS